MFDITELSTVPVPSRFRAQVRFVALLGDVIHLNSSAGTVQVRTQSCIDRSDSAEPRAYAVSKYGTVPSGTGWDELAHDATITVRDRFSNAFIASAFQEKFQTSGIACPIAYFNPGDVVRATGKHKFELDASSTFRTDVGDTTVSE